MFGREQWAFYLIFLKIPEKKEAEIPGYYWLLDTEPFHVPFTYKHSRRHIAFIVPSKIFLIFSLWFSSLEHPKKSLSLNDKNSLLIPTYSVFEGERKNDGPIFSPLPSPQPISLAFWGVWEIEFLDIRLSFAFYCRKMEFFVEKTYWARGRFCVLKKGI